VLFDDSSRPVNSGVRSLFLWEVEVHMKRLLLILFFLTSSVLSSEKAFACVCGGDPQPLSEEEKRAILRREFNQSIAVFAGEVVEIDEFNVKFKISKMWKGDSTNELTMSTGRIKIDETHVRSSSCDYRFKLGEKYLVYAGKFEGGLVAYKCTGTKPFADAERDLKELDNLNPSPYQPPESDAYLLWRNLTTHSTGARVSMVFMILPRAQAKWLSPAPG